MANPRDRMIKIINNTVTISKIGSFENVHGEEFVVYKGKGKHIYYITGDEFGWKGGWQLKRVLLPESIIPIYFACKMSGIDDTFTFNFLEQARLHSLLKNKIK